MTVSFLDALDAHDGIVCAIGAGGKKTTLSALATDHAGRVGVTATVFVTRFWRQLGPHAEIVTDTADVTGAVRTAATGNRIVAWARPSDKPGRVAGVSATSVADCHRAGGFDVTFVKADGARMRGIKAPREDEPPIPPEANLVLPVVSAAAIGRPLDADTAHRPQCLSTVTGLDMGAPITASAVGRLLASADGALRAIPRSARVVPIVNAVDDGERLRLGRRAAELALARSDRFERVVLTCHRPGADRVVTMIERA